MKSVAVVGLAVEITGAQVVSYTPPVILSVPSPSMAVDGFGVYAASLSGSSVVTFVGGYVGPVSFEIPATSEKCSLDGEPICRLDDTQDLDVNAIHPGTGESRPEIITARIIDAGQNVVRLR